MLKALTLLFALSTATAYTHARAYDLKRPALEDERTPSLVPASTTTLIKLRGGGKTAPSAAAAAPMATAMATHAALLAGCGYFANSPMGMGLGIALAASAAASVSGNFPAYMTGVHVALLLQAGSSAAFGVQALRSLGDAALAEKRLLLVAMSSSGVAALSAMRKFKPKKAVPTK